MASLPVRSFDGASVIRCSPGSADITGAWSVAAVLRSEATGVQSVLQGHDSDSSPVGYALEVNDSLRIGAYAAGGGWNEPWSPVDWLPNDAFGFVAVTKATGDAYPTFWRFDFATRRWQPSVAPSRLMNPPSFGTSGYVYFGQYNLDTGYHFEGDLAAVAVWAAELSEATLDQLAAAPSMAGWAGVASPRALWLFDQTSTSTLVSDLVGSAHEIDHLGTSVSFTTDLPIPYRVPVFLRDGGTWSERNVSVRTSTGWSNPISVGVL